MYFINNLGSLYLIFVLFAAKMIVYAMLRPFRDKNTKIEEVLKKMDRYLFWNALLQVMLESYMIVALCCLISMKHKFSFESFGMTIQSLTCFFFTTLLVLAPVYFFSHLLKKYNILKSKIMRTRYKVLYQDLKLENGKSVLLTPGFFLLRRFIMVVVIISDYKLLMVQLSIVFLCACISFALIHNIHSFKDTKWTNIESINEIFILLTLYNFVGFEALTDSIDGPFHLGYIVITIVSLHIVLNILIIVFSTLLEKKLAIRIWWAKFKYKK